VPIKVPALEDQFVVTGDIGSDECVALVTGISQDVFAVNLSGEEEEEDRDGGEQQEEQNSIKVERYDALKGLRISQFSCGSEHNLALTRGGQIFAWGANSSFQLGTGDDEYASTPMKIQILDMSIQITQVCAGSEHSVALASDGTVWTWGSGQMGRLGHGGDADVKQPKLVAGLAKAAKIKFVTCGRFNTGAISQDGTKLFGWGAGANGQLGPGRDPALEPKDIKLPDTKLKMLAFGDRHAACVTDKGLAYTWGNNQFGQLGRHTIETHDVPNPVKKLLPDHLASQVFCSMMTTFFLTTKGAVLGCGSMETKQLGPGAEEDVFAPVEIKCGDGKTPVKLIELSTGQIDCCALTEEGELYVWGFSFEEVPAKVLAPDGAKITLMDLGGDALLMAT